MTNNRNSILVYYQGSLIKTISTLDPNLIDYINRSSRLGVMPFELYLLIKLEIITKGFSSMSDVVLSWQSGSYWNHLDLESGEIVTASDCNPYV